MEKTAAGKKHNIERIVYSSEMGGLCKPPFRTNSGKDTIRHNEEDTEDFTYAGITAFHDGMHT